MNTNHLKRCAYLLALIGSSLAHATVYPWHGVYAGAQLGEVWNRSNFSYTNANYFNTSGATRLGNNFRFKANSFIGGGYAGGKLKINLNSNAANVNAGTSQWINGWALGLGADYRLTRVMTVGVIYDYARLNLNKKTISCPNCGTGFGSPSVDGHINNQAVMARLNYLINV